MPPACLTPITRAIVRLTPHSSHEKTGRICPVHSWLGMRDGNITFEDSLNFAISEIETVYDDEENL